MVGINFEDWEQRKLENITLKIGSGKTPKGGSTVYVESGIPLLRSQNIHSNKVNFEDVVYITEDINKQMLNSSVLKDDVLLNITGASIGRSAVYTADIPANVNQHVCIIRPNQEGNSFFIQLNIVSTKGQKEIDINQAGGGREGLNFQQISKMTFSYPSIEEQMQIGSFFKQLDETIALHQDKLVKLKQLKKGYLQVMFPQKEEKAPRLRFANFSQDWEQRKLREVIESELKGKAKAKAEMTGSENAYLETNYLNGGEISYVNSPSDVDKDDVIILWDGSQAGTVYHGFKGALGSTLKAYKPKESGEFIYHFLKRNQQKIYNNYRTPNIPHVVKTFIDEFYVSIPIFDEQQRISSLFEQLDYTITLHQKKISTLQEIKKIYLQKMFA